MKLYNLVLLLFIISACLPRKKMPVSNYSDQKFRLHDIWVAETIRGQRIVYQATNRNQARPQLEPRVKEMKFYGTDGCNDISGSFEILDDIQLKFAPIRSTKKLCPEMELPNKFNEALKEVRQYKIKELKLYLLDKDGIELVRLQKID